MSEGGGHQCGPSVLPLRESLLLAAFAAVNPEVIGPLPTARKLLLIAALLPTDHDDPVPHVTHAVLPAFRLLTIRLHSLAICYFAPNVTRRRQ